MTEKEQIHYIEQYNLKSRGNIERYSQFIPVLKDDGWFDTGAQGFGCVFFRKQIYNQQELRITVGIVVCSSCWYYCGNISTPFYSQGIPGIVPSPDIEWTIVSEFFLANGLECYKIHRDEVELDS